MPDQLIKRTDENLQELHSQYIELYRSTPGKLIYPSIDRRHLKYVAEELSGACRSRGSRHGVVEVS